MPFCLLLHRRASNYGLRKNHVESLIFLHFDNACSVYHDLYQMQNDKLYRALNACVRFVWGTISLTPRSLVTPIPRTDAFKQSFVFTASSFINTLGHVAFSVQQKASFKFKLFNVLLARDRGDWERRVALDGISVPYIRIPRCPTQPWPNSAF